SRQRGPAGSSSASSVSAPSSTSARHTLPALDDPGILQTSSIHRAPAPALKPDLRGQFFLHDEVLDYPLSTPVHAPASRLHPSPLTHRRKQAKPHKVDENSQVAGTSIVTQKGRSFEAPPYSAIQGYLSDAVMSGDSDDSCILVIDTGMASPSHNNDEVTVIEPQAARQPDPEAPAQDSQVATVEAQTDSTATEQNKSGPKGKRLTKRKKSQSQDGPPNGSDGEPSQPAKKKPKVTTPKMSKPKVTPAKSSEKKKPSTSKSESPEKSSTSQSKGEASVKSPTKRRNSVTQKFEQVEDALEAMFAGLEDDAPRSTPLVKPKKVESSTQPVNGDGSTNEDLSQKSKAKTAKAKKPPPPKKDKDKKVLYKQTQQEQLLTQFNGPFVHVGGDLQKPEWSNVINSPIDSLNRPGSKKPGLNEAEHRKKVQGLTHSSTLSGNYDAKNTDHSWVCVFCKKPSHFQHMGDLFGPYFVPGETVSAYYKQLQSSSGKAESAASKFIIGGDSGSPKKKKKRKLSESSKEQVEVWFHEDCFCWLPEISLIGNRLVGLETAISGAESSTCRRCHKSGSTMTCIRSGCREVIHFPCAQQADWHLDQFNFEATCLKHIS
ncbi:hypothetical protein TCAL_00030, partial [Tigriopus californicus]